MWNNQKQQKSKIFYVEFLTSTFEIPYKISYLYTERYDICTTLKSQELLDLKDHTGFWNAHSCIQ